MIIYDGFRNILLLRGISQYRLIMEYDISPGLLTRLKRNESVSTYSLNRLCEILECDISDIAHFIPEDTDDK